MQRFIALLLLLLAGCATSRVSEPRFDFAALPKYENGPGYKLEQFIPAVMSLQAMGRDAACAALLQAATNYDGASPGVYEQTVVLCRMLFTFREGVEYRHPPLGHTDFFGDTSHADWLLEPIEIVDGYPFWIVPGYSFGGARGPASEYVTYCITNCDWSTFHYRKLTGKEKRIALEKLLQSPKWKRPLDDREQWYLASQITATPLIMEKRR